MVTDFQYKPLFENLLKHLAAIVKRGFVRPHSGQPRNSAKTGAVLDGLVLSPFHGLADVASKHRLNDTRNPCSTPNLQPPLPPDTMGLTPHGGCSSAGRALDCGSSGRGFEPHHPPHRSYWTRCEDLGWTPVAVPVVVPLWLFHPPELALTQ